jgi:hypothetical protein
LARWANQLQKSIATKIRAVAAQRGIAVFGRTIHGSDVRAICENERLSAVTSGTTNIALKHVKMRS